MGMAPFEIGSRSRAAREGGWLGRRRNYSCRLCGKMFQRDLRDSLPVKERICLACRGQKE